MRRNKKITANPNSETSLERNTTHSTEKTIYRRNKDSRLSHYDNSTKCFYNESYSDLSCKSKKKIFPITIPITDNKLILNLKMNKSIPIYVNKDKLIEAVKENWNSNFNNRMNIFYRKEKYYQSKKSEMRTLKYHEWNRIFLNSLREERKNKSRSSLPIKAKSKVVNLPRLDI